MGNPIELDELRKLNRRQCLLFYQEILNGRDVDAVRWLCRNDRFFLLGCMMNRPDVLERDWCFDRCREVEKDPEGHLDLWSRFHYKSTIITLAGSVQEILINPNICICILSYNKPIAKTFLGQIQRTLETPELVRTFPDILWSKPPNTNWSTQSGLIVKRTANPKEPTISGSGLVDGQPIGMHYNLRIYDDTVVSSSVTNPEQIRKTTEAWELSLALGTDDGGREWYAGTRYHPNDTYSEILKRGRVKERRRLCIDEEGNPTMMDKASLEKIRSGMGPFTFAAQMLQNPVADGVRTFKDEWFLNCVYTKAPARDSMNVYILVDGANSKRKGSDYTTMWVVGLGMDQNYYWLDCVHRHLDLNERTHELFRLHRKWRPQRVFWEQVGAMSDVAHVKYVMDHEENYRFPIIPVNRGAKDNKQMRITRLQALFSQGRMWFPEWEKVMEAHEDGRVHDTIRDFYEDEFRTYPNARHDDMLDPMADIMDEAVANEMRWPQARARLDLGTRDWGKGNRDHIFAR